MSAEQLLEGLDPEQREVATALDGPVRVLAGAGTGKTRAITHRLAYGVAVGAMAPTQVLAVTFTTRAAGELRARLAGLGAAGVQARTFHSAALRQARYFWPQVYGRQLPEMVASKLGLLGEAVGRYRLKATQADLRDLAGEIEWAKVSNVRPDDYARLAPRRAARSSGYDAATVAQVFAAYEEVKRDRNRIDMEDVLLCAAAVLGEDERVGGGGPPAVQLVRRRRVPGRQPAAEPRCSTSGSAVATRCAWSATPRRRSTRSPARRPTTCSSSRRSSPAPRRSPCIRNYRSTPEVIAAANTVMAPQIGRGAVELKPTRDAGSAVTYAGHATRSPRPPPVATEISRLVARGTAPAEIAILFRINAQSENFEEALSERGGPVRRARQSTGSSTGRRSGRR